MRIWVIATLALALAAGCAAGRKTIVKSPGEEISELQQMQAGLDNTASSGPLARVKEGIIDQLKRAENA